MKNTIKILKMAGLSGKLAIFSIKISILIITISYFAFVDTAYAQTNSNDMNNPENEALVPPEGYLKNSTRSSPLTGETSVEFIENNTEEYNSTYILATGGNNISDDWYNRFVIYRYKPPATDQEPNPAFTESKISNIENLLLNLSGLPVRKDLINKIIAHLDESNFNFNRLKNNPNVTSFGGPEIKAFKKSYPNLIKEDGSLNMDTINEAKNQLETSSSDYQSYSQSEQLKSPSETGSCNKNAEEDNKPIPFEGCNLKENYDFLQQFKKSKTNILWSSNVNDFSTCDKVSLVWWNFVAQNEEQCDQLAEGSPHGWYTLKKSTSHQRIDRDQFKDLCIYALHQRKKRTSNDPQKGKKSNPSRSYSISKHQNQPNNKLTLKKQEISLKSNQN